MTTGIAALEAHLASGRFRAGAAKGRWKLLELQWPFAFIDVLARDVRRVVLRFDCTGYPETAPTATVWDRAARCQLASASWPRGGRVSQVFNPGWKGGNALSLHPLRPGEHSRPLAMGWRTPLAHLVPSAGTASVHRSFQRNSAKQRAHR